MNKWMNEWMNEWGFRPPFLHIDSTGPRELPEDGEMNEVTLPSRHKIRNSSPGGLRPSTSQHWIFTSEREETSSFFETCMPERCSNPRSSNRCTRTWLRQSTPCRGWGGRWCSIIQITLYPDRGVLRHLVRTWTSDRPGRCPDSGTTLARRRRRRPSVVPLSIQRLTQTGSRLTGLGSVI